MGWTTPRRQPPEGVPDPDAHLAGAQAVDGIPAPFGEILIGLGPGTIAGALFGRSTNGPGIALTNGIEIEIGAP